MRFGLGPLPRRIPKSLITPDMPVRPPRASMDFRCIVQMAHPSQLELGGEAFVPPILALCSTEASRGQH